MLAETSMTAGYPASSVREAYMGWIVAIMLGIAFMYFLGAVGIDFDCWPWRR
jgi:hypothetical protein